MSMRKVCNAAVSASLVSSCNRKLPVFVVEDHNDVLPHIHRLIGSKRIPFKNLTLVHFDSHSDLSVPHTIDASDVFNKDKLYSSTSIENWIIPLAFAGHVSSVIWIKPCWTEQSMKVSNEFDVGEIMKTNKIGVTSRDNFFISELAYASKDAMIHTKSISIHVVTLGNDSLGNCICNTAVSASGAADSSELLISGEGREVDDQQLHNQETKLLVAKSAANYNTVSQNSDDRQQDKGCSADSHLKESTESRYETPPAKRARGCSVNSHNDDNFGDVEAASAVINEVFEKHGSATGFVLDVDLDFFSTVDPFLSVLSDEQHRLMAELYHFEPPVDATDESIQACIRSREEQLSYLKNVMFCMHAGELPCLSDSPRDRLLRKLLSSIAESSCCSSQAVMRDNGSTIRRNPEFDYEWLHEIGTGIDDCPLPHHVSSAAEISRLMNRAENLLKTLPRPGAITVARSSSDTTPIHQVDDIQTAFIVMLENVYGELDVNMSYVDS